MKKILTVFVVILAVFAVASCNKTPRPGEVHGIVNYRDRPAVDVVVTLTGATTISFTTVVGGYYVMRDVPAGDYEASLSFNGRDLNFEIENYEKAEYPYRITIGDNGYHVRNFVIDYNEDMGWDDDDDDEEE